MTRHYMLDQKERFRADCMHLVIVAQAICHPMTNQNKIIPLSQVDVELEFQRARICRPYNNWPLGASYYLRFEYFCSIPLAIVKSRSGAFAPNSKALSSNR